MGDADGLEVYSFHLAAHVRLSRDGASANFGRRCNYFSE
jgi:hypothetical protein